MIVRGFSTAERRFASTCGRLVWSMIDAKRLRNDETYRKAIARKRLEEGLLERVLELDERRRRLLVEVEEARADKNRVSKSVPKADETTRRELIAKMKELGARMESAEKELKRLQAELDDALARLPNPPLPAVPSLDELAEHEREAEGRILDTWGEPRRDEVVDHVEFCTRRGWLELEKASRLSGSRFVYLMREAVELQFALLSYARGIVAAEGFVPVIPPVLVRERGMYDTGFFPAEEFEIYRLERDALYLVGTSEVSLAALHAEETIAEGELPLRYMGYSTCFRREAGSYGKDTRGMFRVHQFDKLEMFSFTLPERSEQEHELILAIERRILEGLDIPYRVIDIAAESLGAPAARKFDIEAWMPSQGRYREVTSCSNCTDFQARRLGARLKYSDGRKGLVHTLNGTAVAVGRMIIAMIENHQTEDGRLRIPEALRPHLGGREIL